MTIPIRPYNYIPGNVIIAAQNNANESLLYSVLAGGIEDDNIGTLTESAITWLASGGHTHDGTVTGGSKIVLSGSTGGDTYWASFTATANGDAITAANSAGSSYAALRGVGNNASSFGVASDNTQALGVGLSATASGGGNAIAASNSAGASEDVIVVTNNSSTGTKSGILVTKAGAGYGVYVNNTAGVSPCFLANLSAIAVGLSITGASTQPSISIASTSSGDAIDITSATTVARTCIDINMTGATGNHVGIASRIDSSGSVTGVNSYVVAGGAASYAGVFKNDGAGLGLEVTSQTGYAIWAQGSPTTVGYASRFASTTTGGALDVSATSVTASGGTTAAVQWGCRVITTDNSNVNALYVGGRTYLHGTFDVSGGGKGFLNPHPKDSTKSIRFVTLEGPENGVYWRTRVRLDRFGHARIQVPEHVWMCIPEDYEMDVFCNGKAEGFHQTADQVIQVDGPPHMSVSVFCLGTRRYYEDFQVYHPHDWSEDREKPGTDAYKAYGPLEN